MKLFFLFILASINCFAIAPPSNDEINNAITINNTSAFCSNDAEFTNIDATSSPIITPNAWSTTGRDVWFKFTATKFDVNISVSGRVNGTSPNTLTNPLVALYLLDQNSDNITEIPGTTSTSNNVTSLYRGSLEVGKTYFIRVSASANQSGTFKLCVDNFFPPISPGQDCGTFSTLCTKETFTQLNVAGAGTNNTESAGTCLGQESNSAWYMFKAAKAGTFTFTITPTVTTNDIDWIFYDLGLNGDCSAVNASNAIRCAAGSGVNCSPSYFKTGLSMTETDLQEASGCIPGQNGFVKFVDLIEGHTYALLIDNFSGGNNSFTLEFGGDAEFGGPTAKIEHQVLNPCTDSQTYTFESKSTNYETLKWNFGEGASIATANTAGPFTVAYSTPGEKIIVLEATSATGCNVVTTQTVFVGKTPDKPTITASKVNLCVDDLLSLSTPSVNLATFQWTGPNNFSSNEQNPTVNITGPENVGVYKLFLKIGDCVSEESSITINSVDKIPTPDFDIIVNNKCQEDQFLEIVNKSTNFTTSNWDFGSGAFDIVHLANNRVTLKYNSIGLKTIKLTIKSNNGCESILSKEILLEKKPDKPTIAASKVNLCVGDLLSLNTPSVNLATFHWTGPNNFTSNIQNPTVNITGTENVGVYKLFIKVGNCVSEESSITINSVDKIPTPDFDIIVNNKCQEDQFLEIVNKSTNFTTLNWDFGSDAFDIVSLSSNRITVKYPSAGLRTVKLTVKSTNGCENSLSKEILIETKPAKPVVNVNQSNFCRGDVIRLSVNATTGHIYHWIGPDNFTATGSTVEIRVNNLNKGGIYQVVAVSGSCTSDAATLEIPRIYETPIAKFKANFSFNFKFAVPITVSFTNETLFGHSYLWDFGDGFTSTDINPSHTFRKAGTYQIKLTASSQNDCTSTYFSANLVINEQFSLLVPNTFTPNGDGINDGFSVNIPNLKQYKLQIFNRYGSIVFNTNDIFTNWDGTYNNTPVPMGVYYYVINGINLDNQPIKYSGSITIIR